VSRVAPRAGATQGFLVHTVDLFGGIYREKKNVFGKDRTFNLLINSLQIFRYLVGRKSGDDLPD
jgi:hypothetical protein